MPNIETMRVIVKAGGHPALINAEDFDPEKFEVIAEAVVPAVSASTSSAFVDVDETDEEDAPAKAESKVTRGGRGRK